MKVISVPQMSLNPISLPGMGRSIELSDVSDQEIFEIRSAFAEKQLFVTFTETAADPVLVINVWPNPHGGGQITLFIK